MRRATLFAKYAKGLIPGIIAGSGITYAILQTQRSEGPLRTYLVSNDSGEWGFPKVPIHRETLGPGVPLEPRKTSSDSASDHIVKQKKGGGMWGWLSSSAKDDAAIEIESPAKSESRIGPGKPAGFLADAVENVLDSVVNITCETETPTLFSRNSVFSSGSGFFIDEHGTILTNAHVVSDFTEGSRLIVTTSDSRTFKGYVYSMDILCDLAVVKLIPNENLPSDFHPVKFGRSGDLRPGDWVIAVGSPFGLQNTVTAGIVSSRRRKSTEIGGRDSRVEFLQSDCVIHSGSSGGPLINLDGEVVGINTTRAESEGIAFSIRVDNAKHMIQQLIKHRRVVRPWLGFRMVSLSPHVWQQLKSKGPDEFLPKVDQGVLITSVYPNSPALLAGCREGDVIMKVNDTPVKSTSQVLELVGFNVGESFKLTIRRNIPMDMDWDGRSRGYEAVDVVVEVKAEELDALNEAEKIAFMAS